MPIPRNIKQYLFHNNVTYVHKIHPPAYTSQEIAETERVPGREFAKTVVLQADQRLILAVIPGDHIVDLDVFKKQIGCERLALATEKEFIERFPACQVGAMPPLGRLFGLPVYCDTALSKQAEIEFNAGTHIDTVRMTFASFANLENPTMLRFSEKRTGQGAARVA